MDRESNIGLLGQVRAGWRQIWQEATLDTGIASAIFPASASESYGGEYLTLDFEQMNRIFFPSRGWRSKLAYFNSSQAGYSKVSADVEAAYPVGDFVVSSRLSYQGALNGKLPYYGAGSLGGFLNLSDFTQRELNGDNIRYGSIRVEKIIGNFPLGLRGDLRAGVALETGKVGTPYTQTQCDGWMNSAAVYLGGETPLGPFYLGYGRSVSGASNIYLFFGTP